MHTHVNMFDFEKEYVIYADTEIIASTITSGLIKEHSHQFCGKTSINSTLAEHCQVL